MQRDSEPAPLYSLLRPIVRTDFYLDLRTVPEVESRVRTSSISAVCLNEQKAIDSFLNAVRTLAVEKLHHLSNATTALAAILRAPESSDHFLEMANNLRKPILPDQSRPFEWRLAVSILGQDILIERSPPTTEMLGRLVHSATSTSLGVWLGSSFGQDACVLTITTPEGVIIIGTGTGLSKGLEHSITNSAKRTINAAAVDDE